MGIEKTDVKKPKIMNLIINKQKTLNILKKLLSNNPVIVEAGAFDGKDTKRLSTTWPQGLIHSFEPVPTIFAMLEKNTRNCSNIFLYPYALSNKNGSEKFYVSEHPEQPNKPFQAGSLKEPKERLNWSPAVYNKTIMVPTTTLDTWRKKHNIGKVDFLWLDVQGHALDVLKASPKTVASLSALFIEVEFIEAYRNQPQYQEVIAWLEQSGFKEIGRDFNNTERWFYGNILFLKSNP